MFPNKQICKSKTPLIQQIKFFFDSHRLFVIIKMNRIRYSNSSRKPIYEDYPPTQAPHLNTEVYNDRGYAQNIVNSQSEYYRGLSHSLQSQERKLFDYQADYPRNDVCYVCGKMGHWAKNCPDNENAVQRGNGRGGYRGRGRGGKNGAFNTRGKEGECCTFYGFKQLDFS